MDTIELRKSLLQILTHLDRDRQRYSQGRDPKKNGISHQTAVFFLCDR